MTIKIVRGQLQSVQDRKEAFFTYDTERIHAEITRCNDILEPVIKEKTIPGTKSIFLKERLIDHHLRLHPVDLI